MPAVDGQQIVDAARSFIGVRWHHQGRNRAGLDCVGLVIVVAWQLGLADKSLDWDGYSRIPHGQMLREELDKHLDRTANPRIGDVLLMRFNEQPQHVAIVTDQGIIHAHAMARKVVEHRLDEVWSSRVIGAYTWRGLNV